jgi:hypothetical protein
MIVLDIERLVSSARNGTAPVATGTTGPYKSRAARATSEATAPGSIAAATLEP